MINDGPILEHTVITIDPLSKQIKHKWGNSMFYLPHGLTFDKNGSIWLTDVALHQVFKFPEKGSIKPLLVLGKRFENGNDNDHFCKPTSTAIYSLNGDIYVADGYCNSRIVRFSSDGVFLNQWGQSDSYVSG